MAKFRNTLLSLCTFVAMSMACDANADCAGTSIDTTKRRYAEAQALERADKTREALAAYVAAQEYTCEPNPVALPAARRAAALALPLARAAERANDLDAAYRLYDEGAHFAESDRALLALMRANPDDPVIYSRARDFFEYRASPAFQRNNELRLAVTGAYIANPQHLAAVRAMPAAGAERAFQQEAAAFDERYLREYVDLIQRRPEDQTDMATVQQYGAAMQAFHQRWQGNPLETSRDALSLAHAWSSITNDRALAEKIAARRRERLEQRILTITRSFYRAPELLEVALDYQMAMHIDIAARDARVAAIREQAATLGNEALTQRRFGLAADYYRVARLDTQAENARELQHEAALAKSQPMIDAMRKQAEDIQPAYGDPQQVQAMQEQARRMQQAIQTRQQMNMKTNAKAAAELEQELGL